MIFSAAADLRAPVVAVDFDPEASPTDAPRGVGCDAADFADVPPDVILLVQGGGCFARQIVDNAAAAGAAGLILTYPGWETNAIRRPTLRTPDVTIPVIGASREMGLALNRAAEAGEVVRLGIRVETTMRPSANVVAETPGGDSDHVVMLGGHLDSVIDGPGINDNGSGTMTILEIARRLIGMDPARKVRFAFWTGEEIGLYGSFRYVGRNGGGMDDVDVYLNFDMLGSPNGGRIVYADEADAPGSDGVTAQFEAYLDDAGLSHTSEDLGGASDHFPFQQRGVPTGGLFSGASELVDAHAAQLFGTEAGRPADACYHLACDRTDNVDRQLLEEMARAVAYVTGLYASGAETARE
jgi:Zn-dependent M28 family amino/carboxypeptidase